jgi:type I restriction enzyme M protein
MPEDIKKTLRATADKLRASMDAAGYKRLVPGLILVKYVSDTFTRNQHPDLCADFILANPPFNISDWWHDSLTGDSRWEYGDPPAGNANYAWLRHMLYHLKPNGRAGIMLADGSMRSSQNSGGDIRRAMIEADVVEVMIALPGQLFFNTQIP